MPYKHLLTDSCGLTLPRAAAPDPEQAEAPVRLPRCNPVALLESLSLTPLKQILHNLVVVIILFVILFVIELQEAPLTLVLFLQVFHIVLESDIGLLERR